MDDGSIHRSSLSAGDSILAWMAERAKGRI
jgi:hypothetical protein